MPIDNLTILPEVARKAPAKEASRALKIRERLLAALIGASFIGLGVAADISDNRLMGDAHAAARNRSQPTEIVLPTETSGEPEAWHIPEAPVAAPESVTTESQVPYTVQSGDSLTKIAVALNISEDLYPFWENAMLQANPHIINPNELTAGEELVVLIQNGSSFSEAGMPPAISTPSN